jgi:hypothetical protein
VKLPGAVMLPEHASEQASHNITTVPSTQNITLTAPLCSAGNAVVLTSSSVRGSSLGKEVAT